MEELRRIFSRLELVMDGEPAIRFADAEILRILTTEKAYCNYDPVTGNIGQLELVDRDGDNMITQEEVERVKLLSNRPDKNMSIFANNTKIETFDEFFYFTGLSYGTALFQGCTSLRKTTLPLGKTLGNTVFNGSGIRKVVIPEGYATIGNGLCNNAQNCRLIDFPSSVTTIGDTLIRIVNNITTIVCRAIIPPVFGGCGYGGVPVAIYVPDASVTAYRTATNWNTFSSKIHPLSEYVES